MTITEFLLARITEDETAARSALDEDPAPYREPGDWFGGDGPSGYSWVILSPERAIAECEAKRRIVEFHQSWPVLVESEPRFDPVDPADINAMTLRMSKQIGWATEREYRARFGTEPPTAPMLRALAAVYAEHPDFDPEWRP